MLTISDLHKILHSESPPTLPGAPKTMIFINQELSLLAPSNNYDEVYPGIFLGDQVFAKNKEGLRRVGITHMLNAAQGQKFHQVNTNAAFYSDEGITFLGIQALDTAGFKMEDHFKRAAYFIQEALENNGKVAVHCVQGISRSATLVVAYLMLQQCLPLVEALVTIRRKRAIYPNDGFLRQLLKLNIEIFATSRSDRDR